MTQPFWEFPLTLPRHAFSVRDAARAGDVWRCFQEAAVEASTRAGWSPLRYRAVGTAFVVRSLVAVHHREAIYGERTRARTWVSRFRRDIFSTRQVRLLSEDGPVSSATQEWAHVSAGLKPTRASAELLAAFPLHEEDPSTELPAWLPLPGARTLFHFEPWFTSMDPLDHANHPAYLDWCDEAISRVMAEAGLGPATLRPVAEKLTFRAGATALERITVESERVGRTERGDLVLSHRVLKEDGTVCAEGTTVRTLAAGDPDRLVSLWNT